MMTYDKVQHRSSSRTLKYCVIFVVMLMLIMGLFALWKAPSVSGMNEAMPTYTTDSFVVDVKANEDCSYNITETITVDFIEAHRGIFRYVPYAKNATTIEDIKVEDYDYQITTEKGYGGSNNKVIRIGDPEQYLTGKHTYIITYKIVGLVNDFKLKADKDTDGFISRYGNSKSQTGGNIDYLSLDLIPAKWETSINHVKATVTMPKAVDWSKAKLFSGKYGADSNGTEITRIAKGETYTVEAVNWPANSGITIQNALGKDYWQGVRKATNYLVPMLLFAVFVTVIICLLWAFFGRDKKFIKTVEFYPPEGMTPTEIGYVVDGTVDNKDVYSLFIYLASKGYVKIVEYDSNKFRVEKIPGVPIDPREKSFVKTFYEGIFENGDESVALNEMPETFSDTISGTKQQVKDRFTGANRIYTWKSTIAEYAAIFLVAAMNFAVGFTIGDLMSGNSILYSVVMMPLTVILTASGLILMALITDKKDSMKTVMRIWCLITGLLFFILANGLLQLMIYKTIGFGSLSILVLIANILTGLSTVFMRARTESSAKRYGQVLGFRDFIKNAELSRIEVLVEENPTYFYDVMPYAYVMGLSNKWAKNFEKLKMEKPDWYSTYDSSTYIRPIIFASVLNSVASQANVSIANTVSASGDIGGGFGGMSGGGFGGGGGGAW